MTATRFAVRTVTDNHEPPRSEAWLTATLFEGEERPAASMRHPVIRLDAPRLRDAHCAVYLWDDGTTVTPYYVAGWAGNGDGLTDWVVLHPVMPRLGTERATSNLRTWALGPRRCYHLKVQETAESDDNV